MDPFPRKPVVFIVDDDESVGKSLSRLLILKGYTASAFHSARSFLDSVPADSVGCILSDIYMPDIDGFMFQQKMFELGYQLPVIFMSAHAKAGDREYALEHGALGFLLKPFDVQSLMEILAKVIPAPAFIDPAAHL